jgi:hypothetical protein
MRGAGHENSLTVYGISSLLSQDVTAYFASAVITGVPKGDLEAFRENMWKTVWLFEHFEPFCENPMTGNYNIYSCNIYELRYCYL